LMGNLVGLLLSVLAHASGACAPIGPPELELVITPTVLRGDDTRAIVRVHGNNCVALVRPAHFRDSGNFALAVTTVERTAMIARADTPTLAGFDGAEVSASLARAGLGGQVFEVLDADRYELTVRAPGGARVLRFEGLPQFAAQYPDRIDLREFAALVDAMSDWLHREERLPLVVTTP
jgi:hypothetical protein